MMLSALCFATKKVYTTIKTFFSTKRTVGLFIHYKIKLSHDEVKRQNNNTQKLYDLVAFTTNKQTKKHS